VPPLARSTPARRRPGRPPATTCTASLLAGRWSGGRRAIEVRNPFDRRLVASVASGTAGDVAAAVNAAEAALEIRFRPARRTIRSPVDGARIELADHRDARLALSRATARRSHRSREAAVQRVDLWAAL